MFERFYPDKYVESAYVIDYEGMYKKGYRGIIFDIDNTPVSYTHLDVYKRQKLGHVTDFEFDQCSGCICKLIVPGGAKWKSFFSCDTDHVICYNDIKQIGPDIIIVDLPE